MIFLIGPGGVGKTTVGKILARKLGYRFIDLDDEFCSQIANIGQFTHTHGYVAYCHRNSELFFIIFEQIKDRTVVMALPSGFLVHEECPNLAQMHCDFLLTHGKTIVLLPSENIDEASEIVVKRQLSRGFGLKEHKERKKFRNRFDLYKNYGDIQIYSADKPEKIANLMLHTMELKLI